MGTKTFFLISCWSLAYFSSAKLDSSHVFSVGLVWAQEEDEDEYGFEPPDGYLEEEEFYPAEPLFEPQEPPEEDMADENFEVSPPPSPERPRPGLQRGRSPLRRGRNAGAAARPGATSNGGFGSGSEQLQFELLGKTRPDALDPLNQKKTELERLKRQYREKFLE